MIKIKIIRKIAVPINGQDWYILPASNPETNAPKTTCINNKKNKKNIRKSNIDQNKKFFNLLFRRFNICQKIIDKITITHK